MINTLNWFAIITSLICLLLCSLTIKSLWPKCWHRWEKRGGTRVGGLFRRCARCGTEEEGFEDFDGHARCITWARLNRT